MSKTIPPALLLVARLVLAGLFLIITLLQTLSFPGQFRHEAATGHGSQVARWVLTSIVALWFFFAQIAIIALERILTAIYRVEMGSISSQRWLNALVRILGISAGYGITITAFAAVKTQDPGPGVVTAALTLFCATTFVVAFFIRYHLFSAQTLSNRSAN